MHPSFKHRPGATLLQDKKLELLSRYPGSFTDKDLGARQVATSLLLEDDRILIHGEHWNNDLISFPVMTPDGERNVSLSLTHGLRTQEIIIQACMFLNDNSLHLLARRRPLLDLQRADLTCNLAKAIEDQFSAAEKERFMIFSGAVLSAYGLRTASDLDFYVTRAGASDALVAKLRKFVSQTTGDGVEATGIDGFILEDMSDASKDLMIHVCNDIAGAPLSNIAQVILDPRFFFYNTDGLKYCSLERDFLRRAHRMTPKRWADLIAISTFLPEFRMPKLAQLPEVIMHHDTHAANRADWGLGGLPGDPQSSSCWTREQFIQKVSFYLKKCYELTLNQGDVLRALKQDIDPLGFDDPPEDERSYGSLLSRKIAAINLGDIRSNMVSLPLYRQIISHLHEHSYHVLLYEADLPSTLTDAISFCSQHGINFNMIRVGSRCGLIPRQNCLSLLIDQTATMQTIGHLCDTPVLALACEATTPYATSFVSIEGMRDYIIRNFR